MVAASRMFATAIEICSAATNPSLTSTPHDEAGDDAVTTL
jgi:hypothetical protein